MLDLDNEHLMPATSVNPSEISGKHSGERNMLVFESKCEDMFLAINQLLEALKSEVMVDEKLKLSSELINQTNDLTSRLLEETETAISEQTSLEAEIAMLELKKRAAFLLTECFAYVVASKRNALGSLIQQLLASIYDCANEGFHYLQKDAIYENYGRILALANLHLAKLIVEDRKLTVDIAQHYAMWLQGISAPIRKASKKYFRDECQSLKHPVMKVTFTAKTKGAQIGTKALVTFVDAHPPILFHVKAHQNYTAMSSGEGSGQWTSSQTKGIDLKELFIYKVLELTGLGPKVHFITHQASEDRAIDKNALFIATQDVAYTKSSKVDIIQDESITATKASSSTLKELAKEVAVVKQKKFQPIIDLYHMNKAGIKEGNQRFLEKFQQELSSPEIGPIKFSANLIDIIARIFRLSDLNADNFGYVMVTSANNSYEKLKIFDFVISDSLEGRYVIGDEDGITEGFLTGNGVLRHQTAFLTDAVMGRERKEKIEIGIAVIDTLEGGQLDIAIPVKFKLPLAEAINQAFDELQVYLEEPIEDTSRAAILGIDLEKSILELRNYQHAVLENFQHLKTGLYRRQDTLTISFR